jgi:Spy/CpxP family protein refolding chaperone
MLKILKAMAFISILVWAVSSVHNASAEPGAEPIRPSVMKRYTGAQDKGPVSLRLENMTKQLGLSIEQQAEIKKILLDENIRLKDFRANANQNAVENKAKMQELRNDTNNKIRLILTTEQQKNRDVYIKDISDRHKSRENN